MEEIWRQILDSNYAISNYGNVKSVLTNQILKTWMNEYGYAGVSFRIRGKKYTKIIHLLVWDIFGDKPRNGMKLQVDHKDENKVNNRIDNLQLLTPRQNTIKSVPTRTSRFTGVHWASDRNKWRAAVHLNGKQKLLGSYVCESLAGLAYQKALIQYALS